MTAASDAASIGERTAHLFLLYGGFVLACDQLLIVQPTLYLEPLGHCHAWVFRVVAVSCLLLGGWVARRDRDRGGSGVLALLVAAMTVSLSALARFWAFDYALAYSVAVGVLPCVSLFAYGYGIVKARKPSVALLKLPSGDLLWLHPFALVGFVLGLGIAATLESVVGPLRSSLAIGGATFIAASLVERQTPRYLRARYRRNLAYLGTASLAALAIFVEQRCPIRRVLASTHALIYTTATDRVTLDVTAGQGGLHYFVNGELRFSSIDEYRFYESLVLPALMRVERPERVLVLSQGEGLIEREIERIAPRAQITSVMRDKRIAQSSIRQAYLRRLTKESLLSPRVHLIEKDPAAYALLLTSERFDVIIVDLPDPSGPLEAKYYSRLFYHRLALHLTRGGLLSVQATSARRSPRTYAIIGKTLEAAGFAPTPLMVPLVTRGEWSLYLCSLGALPEVLVQASYLRTFPGSFEQQMMSPWPDTLPPKDFIAVPNTLHDAIIREWFEEESNEASDT